MKQNILKDKSFGFAIIIVSLYKQLVERNKEFVMSKQLLRSGTSVGAMIREAQNAESRADFIHKLAIAQKECDETLFWLELLKETGYLHNNEFEEAYGEATSILKMLRSAIISSKKA